MARRGIAVTKWELPAAGMIPLFTVAKCAPLQSLFGFTSRVRCRGPTRGVTASLASGRVYPVRVEISFSAPTWDFLAMNPASSANLLAKLDLTETVCVFSLTIPVVSSKSRGEAFFPGIWQLRSRLEGLPSLSDAKNSSFDPSETYSVAR
jgi:hypothetical protein